MDVSDQIGKRIKLLRKGKNLSQSAFAKAVGLSQSAIAQYESGERVPSGVNIAKICNFFHVSLFTMVGDEQFGDETEMLIAVVNSNLRRMKLKDVQLVSDFVARLSDS